MLGVLLVGKPQIDFHIATKRDPIFTIITISTIFTIKISSYCKLLKLAIIAIKIIAK